MPWQYIGRALPVRITDTEVIVCDPQVREMARHALWPRSVTGQCRVQPGHRPAQDTQQRQAQLRERFAELGAVAVRFFDALLKAQRYGKGQAQRVLALLATYQRRDLLASLERAVRYGACSYAAVERILAVQAPPKSVLENLAEEPGPHLAALLGDAPVSPRPLTDYRSLFGEEAAHEPPSTPPDPADPADPADPVPEPGPPAADADANANAEPA